MIDIVELRPNQADTVLNEGLDKLAILEDRDIYYYFRDYIFYRELDHFIYGRDKKAASKIRNTENIQAGEKNKVNHENNLIRLKFIKSFESSRQNYFLFKERIHTYTINNLQNPTNIITIHQWENEEIINDLESLAKLRRKSFFGIIFGSYK